MSQTIFRNCGSGLPFTTLPNQLLQDQRLTWEERGMLCDLLSRPDNFDVNVSGLAVLGKRSRDKIYSLLKNPVALGYIEKEEPRSERGAFDGVVYNVYSLCKETREKLSGSLSVLSILPDTENPDTVKPDTVKSTQQKNNSNKEIEEKKEKDEPQAVLFAHDKPSKRKANKIDDDKSGYLAFTDKFKAVLKNAGRTSRAAGLSDGRKVWATLDQVERSSRFSALDGYQDDLKANTFKHPQHIDRFLNAGWEDFQVVAPDPQKVQTLERELQIRSLALDLDENTWTRAVRWWRAHAEVPGDIIAEARNYIAENFSQLRAA
jgi:hypothetical protein